MKNILLFVCVSALFIHSCRNETESHDELSDANSQYENMDCCLEAEPYEPDDLLPADIFAERDSVFFMDVDFDDQNELVVRSEGYNIFYYTCYKIQRNSECQIVPMKKPFDCLYGGGVSYGDYGRTIFNEKDSTITLERQVGSLTHHHAKYKKESDGNWTKLDE